MGFKTDHLVLFVVKCFYSVHAHLDQMWIRSQMPGRNRSSVLPRWEAGHVPGRRSGTDRTFLKVTGEGNMSAMSLYTEHKYFCFCSRFSGAEPKEIQFHTKSYFSQV